MPRPPHIAQAWLGPGAEAAGIRAGFTTRALGNLALDVGQQPARVRARRAALAPWAGGEVGFAHHVHGTRVLEPPAGLSLAVNPAAADPTGDAWCARSPAALGVLAADCLPVLLADPTSGILGAAHAGRVGLLAGVLPATVQRMRERGAGQIHAAIGPGICGQCYEVSAEVAEGAAAAGFSRGTSRWGTPAIDLFALARAQLHGSGVEVHAGRAIRGGGQPQAGAACTLEDPQFFSHRSPARTGGRHAGIITSRASAPHHLVVSPPPR